METETGRIIGLLILFGWIPILTLGKAISWCIEARTCSKCTCKECIKESEDK
jgi:hypothetical protein